MSLSGITTKASELAALRTIPRAKNWVEPPEALSSQGTFGAYPPGSENYSYGAPYMHWARLFSIPDSDYTYGLVEIGGYVLLGNGDVVYRSYETRPFHTVVNYASQPLRALHNRQDSTIYGGFSGGSGLLKRLVSPTANTFTWQGYTNATANLSSVDAIAAYAGQSLIVCGGAGAAAAGAELWFVFPDLTCNLGYTANAPNTYANTMESLLWYDGWYYVGLGTPDAYVLRAASLSPLLSGWQEYAFPAGTAVKDMKVFGGSVYASVSPTGVWKFDDDALEWSVVKSLLSPSCLCASDSYLYCGMFDGFGSGYVLRSADGVTWSTASPPLGASSPSKMHWKAPYLYVAIEDAVWVGREL